MKKNTYYLKARLFPTIICAIPILSTYFFGFSDKAKSFVDFLQGFTWTGDVTISVALIFLMVQTNRFAAKEIFQRFFFKDEIKMPTTNYLLHSDSFFSKDIKRRLYLKVFNDFKITLADEDSENQNELEARKTIITAVSQIRNTTRENKLLLQHNIEYGFMRNLVGGAAVAGIISLFNLYYFSQITSVDFAFKMNLVLIIIYLIPILFSKVIVKRYGHYYAKVLFEQYLNN
ncbi:hypothetical protein GQR60_12625 [Labilibaculum sp. A4]|uniref:hypothetical protein n=1 Tax=Labilibaculum euxinus TaxID=2686357 RepID=UPI000F61E340|nr:hypothetical protein [Labilibaculum euxinus]MDQ1771399.1 hypothetical protein [Labilibaculum euxinus]MWN77187.1 hypothetical protein [Labilibaculum euxinus]